jgi:transposase-like protein
MAKHRTHSIEFKRQVAQEFLAGATLHGLAKRHDICRNLIRIWVQKYEAGDFDEDAAAADLLQQYEARIAALERLVGKQALELEFLKGAVKSAPRPKSATLSVVVGPRPQRCRRMPADGNRPLDLYDKPAAQDDTAIVEAISGICEEFEFYGWRRVRSELRHRGLIVNHKKVRRLMREHDLQPRRRRRYVATTDSDHASRSIPSRQGPGD